MTTVNYIGHDAKNGDHGLNSVFSSIHCSLLQKGHPEACLILLTLWTNPENFYQLSNTATINCQSKLNLLIPCFIHRNCSLQRIAQDSKHSFVRDLDRWKCS